MIKKVLLALLLTFTLAACTSTEEKEEQAPDVKIELNEGEGLYE